MALGKEIKVVLSLDDSGFTSKSKAAKESVQQLQVEFGNFTKAADKLETSVSELSTNIKGFGEGFTATQKLMREMSATLAATVDKMTSMAASSGRAAKGVKDLADSASPLSKSLSSISSGTKELGDTLSATQQRLALAREGFAKLDAAQTASGASAKKSAKEFSDSRVQALRAEIENDDKIIAKRAETVAKLKKLENDLHAQAIGRETAYAAPARAGVGGKMVSTKEDQAAEAERLRQNATANGLMALSIQENIDKMKAEQAARRERLAGLQQEVAAEKAAAEQKQVLDRIANSVGKSNVGEVERMRALAAQREAEATKQAQAAAADFSRQKKIYADEEARAAREAERQKQAAMRETAQIAREQARQLATEQQAHAAAIAQMWRSMAQGYAGAKIERGLGVTIDAADQMERAQTGVRALNMGADQENALFASAAQMSNSLKFISTLDAIKSRMSAIASLGYNNVEIIDKTLESAVKASNNLQYLGVAHGDMQSMIRNMYGVVEMRQQTGSAEQTNATFNVLQKIIAGTGGKVQTQDMETVLRRLGMGASQLSDQGMINLAAIVDQFKVAGGDSGGAGGGVSTVGTAFKMMQAYALGKGLSNEAVKEFAGANILSTGGMDLSQDKAGVLKDAKHAGFQDADLWLKDPVAAVQKIMPKIIDYTQKAENRGKFYQGRDMNDAENQMVAVSMYLARLGITTTASQALMVAGDPRSKERIAHQSDTINHAKGIDAVNDDMRKNVGQQWTEIKAQTQDLAILIGEQLLPPLKEVLTIFASIIQSAKQFASNNPMATQLTAIGAAAAGVVLAWKGFTGMFGIVGSASNVLRSLLGVTTQVGMATQAAGGQAAAAGGAWSMLTGHMANHWTSIKQGVTQHYPAMNAAVLGFAGAINGGGSAGSRILLGFEAVGKGAMAMGKMVAGGFLRMIPLLGELLIAWDFAQLIAHLQVGGAEIGAWAVGLADYLVVVFENLWERIKDVFTLGINHAEHAAAIAKNNAGLDARWQANGLEDKPQNAPQTKEMAQLDAINHDPNYNVKAQKKIDDDAARKAQLAKAEKERKDREAAAAARANKSVMDAASSGGKEKYERVDPLTKALEEARGKVNANKTILGELKAGAQSMDGLRKEVIEELEGKRLAGDFNKDHDVKNPVARDNKQYQDLIEQTYQLRLQTEQKKALTFANERVAASQIEANDAMERLNNDGAAKQTDAFRALTRELERAQERLGAGAKGFAAWNSAKNRALYGQAGADLMNFSADYSDKNRETTAQLLPTDHARQEAELAAAAKAEDKKYDMRVATIKKMRDATVQSILDEGPPSQAALAEIAQINEDAQQKMDAADQVYSERKRLRALQDARALETPIQSLAREWADTTKNVESMTANWANSLLDAFMNFVKTGKMGFSDLIQSMIADLIKLKVQQQSAPWLDKVFGAAGDAILGYFTDGAGAAGAQIGGASGAYGAPAAYGVQPGSTYGSLGSGFSSAGTPFANGGIMTAFGPAELRKYANGGIANSPQVAIYGEGSMNEAYVPLPDGRSIPVTMTGGQQGAAGGTPNITINMINQSGTPMNATQGGSRFDGKQMILDVVVEAATSPGPFRDTMKGAMKS